MRVGGFLRDLPTSGTRGVIRALTMVADMPGYPIRKLPFAGPETRTKAAMSNTLHLHHHGHAAEGAQWSCGEPAS